MENYELEYGKDIKTNSIGLLLSNYQNFNVRNEIIPFQN